jgi:subtilisin family serine protease
MYFNHLDPVGDLNGDGNLDDDGNGKVDDFVGWDFVDNDNDPTPKNTDPKFDHGEHGTIVAGIIGARIGNDKGVAGLAGGARILPLRITPAGLLPGEQPTTQLRDALTYAVNLKSRDLSIRRLIVNISLATDALAADPLYRSAIDMAYQAGVLIVQSSGNGSADGIGDADTFRQLVQKHLVVAGTSDQDTLLSVSNFGIGIDLVAPAANFSTTWNDQSTVDQYGGRIGTSISAAVVSGVAALVWSQDPSRTHEQVAARLLGTATNVDAIPGNARFAGGMGSGLVNAAAALDASVAVPAPSVLSVRLVDFKGNVTGITQLRVKLSQILDSASANLSSNYELRNAGPDGQFDPPGDSTPDDRVFPVQPGGYALGSNEIILDPNATLPVGDYRLRLNAGGTNGLKSPFGVALTGETDQFFKITSGVGKSGDVIIVDLKQTLGGSAFSALEFNPIATTTDDQGDIHLSIDA